MASALPTLLRKGFIVPPKGISKSQKDAMSNMRSIDYIINYISDRTSESIGGSPKYVAKCMGDKILILKSDTGSGKSTVLGPFLYETFNERTRGTIGITQPRVLTAIDIANGLPEHYTFLEMGRNLGYVTGDYKRKPSEKGIIFMTTGILRQQMKVMTDEEFMKKYSFILVDEVHVRDINIDMILYEIKKFLEVNYKNPECPMIILMSATFEPKLFADYYGTPKENIISVVGSTFPIESCYLSHDTPNYIAKAIEIAKNIHNDNLADITETNVFRDILIFVLGQSAVKEIINGMNEFNSMLYENNTGSQALIHYIAPIELTGKSFGLSGVDYQNLFSDINNILIPVYKMENGKISTIIDKWVKPSRRIIVATNIAETGLTIETLKYCIDTGFVNSMEFNSDYGAKVLLGKNVTQGMAIQRKGRVGRKAPGFWYPCYTKKTFDNLLEKQLAVMLNSDISESLLSIIIKETDTTSVECKSHHISNDDIIQQNLYRINHLTDNKYYKTTSLKSLNIASVDFLEMPSSSSLTYSVEKLHGLGFIDNLYNPTTLGLFAFKMHKISVENMRMLLAGYSHGANILNLITVIAFVEHGRQRIFHRKYTQINMFKKKLTDKEYEFYHKIVIGDEMAEYILIWDIYSEYLDQLINKKTNTITTQLLEDWCLENKLQYKGMLYISGLRDEIIESLISIGLNPYYNGMDVKQGTYNLLHMFRQNLPDFVLELKKIKHCILDGYRFNLCVWNNKEKSYVLHYRNIPIYVRCTILGRMGDDAIQTNPNFIILSDIMLRASMKNKGMYEFESSGSVSIMDTYVNVDLNFLNF
jgi:HrpA-like RNA helicase